MPTLAHNENDLKDSLLAPNTILQSRYRIVRRMGKGGMGAVYEAIDLRLDATVALKQALTQDEELWKQFEREARLVARLNHPVLPRVSDYFTEGSRAFFVMQYVEGTDLSHLLVQQPGPLPRSQVVAWADQLLDALIYLHSRDRQIIHRDIKPHNLKVTPDGRIVLLDFGLAKSEAQRECSSVTCTSVFGYTPRYAPLEQIQDLGTSPQSDIYALGATLYHLLTGIKPPDALTRAAALVSLRPNPLTPANELNEAVGSELAEVIARAMAQNPGERYASATEFREALRCIGRTDNAIVATSESDSIENEPVPSGETTQLRIADCSSTRRLGSRAIAAALVILIASFAVFCKYYSWKLPPAPAPDVASASTALVPATIQARGRNSSADRFRNQSKTRQRSNSSRHVR
jgi:serine/threonine protein kinase